MNAMKQRMGAFRRLSRQIGEECDVGHVSDTIKSQQRIYRVIPWRQLGTAALTTRECRSVIHLSCQPLASDVELQPMTTMPPSVRAVLLDHSSIQMILFAGQVPTPSDKVPFVNRPGISVMGIARRLYARLKKKCESFTSLQPSQ
ncbi:hypothetical protein KM043_002190 [Ampulex compressa]|nr:hypothetical protein KM043_002190 [Ampulex compressa]